jgi:hypothetical protein
VKRGRREDGNTMVEMALVSAFVYLPMLFGVFQVSYGLYVYNYVCSAAHQATRYAAVRGVNSCTIQSNFVDCNLSPAGSTNPSPGSGTPLQNYVQSFGFMGIDQSKITVTGTWYTRSNDNSGGFSNASWTPACTTSGCNAIGNAVEVSVVYQFPLNIPFWKNKTLPITGVSKMMISE